MAQPVQYFVEVPYHISYHFTDTSRALEVAAGIWALDNSYSPLQALASVRKLFLHVLEACYNSHISFTPRSC